MVTSDSKTQLHMESETNKKANNKLWILLCSVLGLCCTGLVIGINKVSHLWHGAMLYRISVRGNKDLVLATQEETAVTPQPTDHKPTEPAESEVCDTAHCVMIAGKLLENIDPEVDPCDNFYEFACGKWLKRTVIPEDLSRYTIFSVLHKELQAILKELFEREKTNQDVSAITKVKDMYASCVDLETIENRDADPLVTLLNALGGWPVLGSNNGGNWDEADFDLETLMGRLLGEFDNHNIVSSWVGIDDKDSSRHVLKIDQAYQGMPSREYYLEDQYAHYKQAYLDYMIAISTMLGADPTTAQVDMGDVLEYETKLANFSIPYAERRDTDALYNPTTIQGLMETIPQINWKQLLDIVLPEEILPFSDTEKIINRSPIYLANAARLTEETEKRVVANYMVWRITQDQVSTLSKRFRDAEQAYDKVLYGTSSVSARWRNCVDFVNDRMTFSSGRMYVAENFKEDSKRNVEEMVTNIKTAFKELLEYNEWMDEETKVVAREKCDAISTKIGYPDWILDDGALNDYYSMLKVSRSQYFENKLSYNKWDTRISYKRLREPVEDRWSFGPAWVNAYYDASRNSIVFPAGILQPPFYHVDSPGYLNYGGIGVVIGHEITHGFDDRGRRYDKDGNLKQWWNDEAIKNFKEKTQCIINQYGQYVMPENNKAMNGILTQGENIADCGGFKQTFKAFLDNESSNLKLPGLFKYTSQQLLSLNFGQVWCSAYTREDADNQILTAAHSPGRYRVIGSTQNLVDFANAFNCPADSYMNPPEKCVVW